MIKTFDMRDRDRPLDVFGPPGLKALFQQVLRPVIGRTKYPLDVIELEPHDEVGFDDFVIASFPVNHRVEAYGYAFIEDDRPGPLRRRGGAPARRRRGPGLRPPAARRDRQRRHARAGRGGRPRRAAGSSTPATPRPVQSVEVYAADADVLVHEATFCEDEKARARETGHSTAAPGRADRRATPASSCSR